MAGNLGPVENVTLHESVKLHFVDPKKPATAKEADAKKKPAAKQPVSENVTLRERKPAARRVATPPAIPDPAKIAETVDRVNAAMFEGQPLTDPGKVEETINAINRRFLPNNGR